MNANQIKFYGWLPDYPDLRDYTILNTVVSPKSLKYGVKNSINMMAQKIGICDSRQKELPLKVDLRKWCSPIEDQDQLGSCTANAAAGLIEYFEKKAFGNYINCSRLFLYKATRNLLQKKGDFGAYIRTTMMAMVLFGIAPEKYWEYDIEKFDEEPGSFCYSYAQNYQTAQYFRLDPDGIKKGDLLEQIKINLAAMVPSMFGFTVYSSIAYADKNEGKIPFPSETDKVEGGHAVVAVGYDDEIIIKNINGDSQTKGALLIRNSWGSNWGNEGYGWLPYEYILRGLAVDWWTILENEWIDTGNFKLE
ncbi:MAG: C1 family peptidase [Candidatus Humimicrobiaceae bacterium]